MTKNGFDKRRIAVMMIILAVILMIYAASMYEVQVLSLVEGGEANAVTTTYSTATANRGSILDRNGVELVSTRAKYNVKIDRLTVLAQDNTNEIILGLVQDAVSTGTNYTDTFPVTSSGPFSYVAGMTDVQKSRLTQYLEFFDLDEDISASDLIIWMRDHYGIDYLTSINDARRIIGIRYEMEIRAIMNTAEYVFANDISLDFITCIKEKKYPGVSIVTEWDRVYHTEYASHLLGYVGLMNADEYETYSKLGYPMDAVIGKDGVEKAFEEYLHGVDGVLATEKDSEGNVVNTYMETEAQPGGNVFLTIDINMQKVAEEALASTIAEINSNRKPDEELADGGAVVVKDVNSGEVLTAASYPNFDLSTMMENYTELVNDPSNPMFNRATLGTYNPGSTFKMVTAFAGMESGYASRYTTIEDRGKYTRYNDYQPVCWVYPSNHGPVDLVGALEDSCNYYFYWLSDRMGIAPITKAALNFGFGQKTGIEIAESPGVVYSVDYKENTLGENWFAADTIITSIGQRDMITPIQLSNYVSAIANDGTLYQTTLFSKVMNEDYTETLVEKEPSVLKMIEGDEGYLAVLREGMRAVTATGTAAASLADYPVKVAAKTGTVQSDDHNINSGVFVCYAPAYDPEIAIAVVVESGGSGSGIISVAEELLDYYFADDQGTSLPAENTIS